MIANGGGFSTACYATLQGNRRVDAPSGFLKQHRHTVGWKRLFMLRGPFRVASRLELSGWRLFRSRAFCSKMIPPLAAILYTL
jgi:hypothetical protein